jgi:F-type H+-transporting ATPase subunit delta
VPLWARHRERLLQRLRARYGASLEARFEVDADLIGGVWIRIGDEVLDGTIAGRLAALREKLGGSSPSHELIHSA